MEKPDKNTTGMPREVPEDIRTKQTQGFSKADFQRALANATQRLRRAAGTKRRKED